MIGNSDNETNFPHKLFLTNRQVTTLRKEFSSHTSTDIKLSKTELSRMIQPGRLLGKLLGSLPRTGLPLIKNVIKPSVKSDLVPLRLTAAASAADAGIHRKILRSSHNKSLIISNDELEDFLKIVKSLEDSGISLEGVSETIKNEAKEQNGGFLSILLGTLGVSLLGDMFVGKGVTRAREGTAKVGFESKMSSFKKIIDSITSFNKL